jgi:hypothetical protein
VRFQLRVYRIAGGAMDEFVREWFEHVRPLRLRFGFSVLGPWVGDDGETFVCILGHDGDFAAAEQAYYGSPARLALEPDPARHVAEEQAWLMRSPARRPPPGR